MIISHSLKDLNNIITNYLYFSFKKLASCASVIHLPSENPSDVFWGIPKPPNILLKNRIKIWAEKENF